MGIEEKYDEVQKLIDMGKEKGYLLYEEVGDMLPAEITSADELDDIFSMFGSMGIEVVDSEQKYREKAEGEGPEGGFKDLPPYLEGVKIDGRWVIIYSKYDLGCSLEDHKSTDCLGHTKESYGEPLFLAHLEGGISWAAVTWSRERPSSSAAI